MVQQGLQAGTAMQAYSLLQEKIQKLRQMGEEAFNQGKSVKYTLSTDEAGCCKGHNGAQIPGIWPSEQCDSTINDVC